MDNEIQEFNLYSDLNLCFFYICSCCLELGNLIGCLCLNLHLDLHQKQYGISWVYGQNSGRTENCQSMTTLLFVNCATCLLLFSDISRNAILSVTKTLSLSMYVYKIFLMNELLEIRRSIIIQFSWTVIKT